MASFWEEMTGIRKCPGCQKEILLEKEYCDDCVNIASVNENVANLEIKQKVRLVRDMRNGRETKMRYCSKCGSSIIPGAAFCSSCGNKIVQKVIQESPAHKEDHAEIVGASYENKSAFGWYLHVLKNYAVFKGRARRKEFWYFCLFHFSIIILLFLIEYAITGEDPTRNNNPGVMVSLYALATLIPFLAVSMRRLHDTNRSGWWVLLYYIPIANFFLLASMARRGQPGENEYGYNPKE